MQPNVTKLLKIVQKYCTTAKLSSIPDATDPSITHLNVIEVPCSINHQDILLKIYFDSYDFQICIGDMLTIDKIEDDDIHISDVEPFIVDLLQAMQDGRASMLEYTLLGKKAHSLVIKETTLHGKNVESHTPYVTLSDELAKLLGRKTSLGLLKVVKP